MTQIGWSVMGFEEDLKKAMETMSLNLDIKPEQKSALEAIYSKKDVLCMLRTGFGKSLIYQITPFLLETIIPKAITIILSPLNAIMKDQVSKLSKTGVLSCFIDMKSVDGTTYCFKHSAAHLELEDSSSEEDEAPESDQLLEVHVPLQDIMKGNFRLVYSHPEALLSTSHGQQLLRSAIYQERVCCIAIDEAHMVQEWGHEFRKDFSRLQEILGLFPDVPTAVLTATASPKTQTELIQNLGLRDPVVVSVHPDRANIKYNKHVRLPSSKQEEDLDELLSDIAEGLIKDKSNYPITLVYTDLEGIRYSYRYLESVLGNEQYNGVEMPEHRVFAQYHHHYTPKMKDYIVSELCRPNSVIRVVFATVALGMGLDAPAIRRVIHFKSPTTIEKYLQETGRAGRDGKYSDAILYVNNTDIRPNRPGQQKEMTEFCRSSNTCLRQQLLHYLGFKVDGDRQLCRCCNVCEVLCECNDCKLD